MPVTPNQQNPGCNAGVLTVVISLVAIGGVVAFFASDGDLDYFPGFLVPLIFIFVVLPIISRAVKRARKAATGGSSTESRPVAANRPSTTANRQYRYRSTPEPGASTAGVSLDLARQTVVDEEAHQRAVQEIVARRKKEEGPSGIDVVFDADSEAEKKRKEEREARKRKLDKVVQTIRDRNRRMQTDTKSNVPPGYTVCLSCGRLTPVKGRRTRCLYCGSVIESS